MLFAGLVFIYIALAQTPQNADFKKGYDIVSPYLKSAKNVEKSLWDKAIPHFKKSCDDGYSPGCYFAGAAYGDLKNHKRASSLFAQSCKLGNSEACSMAKDQHMHLLNQKAESGKITVSEIKTLCDWGASKPEIGINAVCGGNFKKRRLEALKPKMEKIQAEGLKRAKALEVALKKLKKRYKEVIKLDGSNGGIWELNQIAGEWVLFAAGNRTHQLGIRRSTLPNELKRGMMLYLLTNYIGKLGQTKMKNISGFDIDVFQYDAVNPSLDSAK